MPLSSCSHQLPGAARAWLCTQTSAPCSTKAEAEAASYLMVDFKMTVQFNGWEGFYVSDISSGFLSVIAATGA